MMILGSGSDRVGDHGWEVSLREVRGCFPCGMEDVVGGEGSVFEDTGSGVNDAPGSAGCRDEERWKGADPRKTALPFFEAADPAELLDELDT